MPALSAEKATTAPTQDTATGVPAGVTLTKMSPSETSAIHNTLYSEDDLASQGVTLTRLDAPHNSVFDQDRGRVLSLPQTLNSDETDFVIKRDVDQVKNFFAMQDVGGFRALGRGFGAGPIGVGLPQAVGALGKEAAETTGPQKQTAMDKILNVASPTMSAVNMMFKVAKDLAVTAYGKKDLIEKSDALIQRNKKYMADAGWTDENLTPLNKVLYQAGSVGNSVLASIGLTYATRNPATAAVVFGAIQKTQTYQEARDAGKSPEEASRISTVDGSVNAALELMGGDGWLKALKGNSAVKGFAKGFLAEAAQEGSQQAANELITQSTGVRTKSLQDTAEDILLNAAVGGIVGGTTSVALGHHVEEQAKAAGIDDKTAKAMGQYTAKNVDKAKKNSTEFIDRELAPIGEDSKSVARFMTLMQKFGTGEDIVQRDSLDPEDQPLFDEYIKYFDTRPRDDAGIAEAEKSFYDRAIAAGVDPDQAAASSKLIGARADAASRALGITPQEWLDSKNLSLQVEGKENLSAAGNQAEELPHMEEARSIKYFLSNSRKNKLLDRSNPASVQSALKLPTKPKTVLQFIQSKGGISLGISNQEAENLKDHNKRLGRSTSKIGMAIGELRQAFDGKKGAGRYLKEEGGNSLEDIHQLLVDNGYLEGQAYDENQANEPDVEAVIDLISKEAGGEKVYPLDIESQIDDHMNGDAANLDYLNSFGLDENSSAEEIRQVLADRDQVHAPFDESSDNTDEEIPFYQDGKGKARGSIEFGKDRTIINLFKGANPSTILHELGHLFLRDMRDVASNTNKARIKADYEIIKKWLGAKGNTLTVKQEEKFARGFEQYLREGKAPLKELQSVFDKFKDWLQNIYKSAKSLNVELTPEVRKAFDRMLGADYAEAEKLNQEQTNRDIEADYEKVAATPPKNTFWADTGDIFRDVSDLAADAFVPISTRLGKIDQALKHAVRRYMFDMGLHSHTDRVEMKPWISAVSEKMSEPDYRILDLALKNRDTQKVDFLMEKYGIEEEFAAVRKVLDDLYNEAVDAGIEVSFIEDYFPRQVKRGMVGEYLAAIQKQEVWSEIEAAMKDVDPNGTFTPEEEADFVNKYLRGFNSSKINLSKPSFTKSRSVDYVTPEFNQFYEDSIPTVMNYISGMRHGIESSKLFGKSEKDIDESIGSYVLSLVQDGTIDYRQEAELKKLLKAAVDPTGTRGAFSWIKNASYVWTMGNPLSAITQIQDLAFSLHTNGYWRTGVSLAKSLSGKQVLKKEDLGIDNVLQEFEDASRASKAVKKVFDAIGLTFMDNVGKEVYIDASYSRLKSMNKKNSPAFNDLLETIFGEEAGQVKQDLADDTMSENVKYLLFSELSDVQPVSLAEMPRGYLRGGNGRIWYMLKSYTIKQIDTYRREIFSHLASGDAKRTAIGLKNLVSLGISLMLMGMGTDALKDLILGRKIDVSDLMIDNALKLTGLSKYQIYKGKESGYDTAFWVSLAVPPILDPLADTYKDITKIAFGDKKAKDSELLGSIPFVGKFYYWWWGGGRSKEDKKEKSASKPKHKKKAKVSTP